MSNVRASIIINNYNYGAYVGRAVDSALAQVGAECEVIVVDDGSTDESRSILDAYRGRVKLVFQDNRGQAAAINAGVQVSRGEVLCFLDSDDWWAPGKSQAILHEFDADPGVSLVYHRLQPVLPDPGAATKPIPRTLCSGDLRSRLILSAGWWPFPMTSAVSIRRSAWDEAGPIPDAFRISADAWLVGICPFLGRVTALPSVLGFYRIHPVNNWHCDVDDETSMRKRAAHWKATVDETNRFLLKRGGVPMLRMADHFPYRVATARLDGIPWTQLLPLALKGFRFAGEPNPLRRARDTLRAVTSLCGTRTLPQVLPEQRG